jgi:hypothetical protein
MTDYVALKLQPIAPGDKVAMVPDKKGNLIAVKLDTIAPGDNVVMIPTSTGNIAVKLNHLSLGDKVLLVPQQKGGVVKIPLNRPYLYADANLFSSPAFSPDYKTIYYIVNPGGVYSLRALDISLTPFTVLWTTALGGTVSGLFPLTVGLDGVIYLTNANNFYAINPDGTVKWNPAVANVSTSTPTLSPDESVAYIIDRVGNLRAYYTSDGSSYWNYQYGATTGMLENPAVGSDGIIYYFHVNTGVVQQRFVAVHPDGTVHWTTACGHTSSISRVPPLMFDSEARILWYLYSGGVGRIHSTDAAGAIQWEFDTDHQVVNKMILRTDGRAAIADYNSCIYALNTDGSQYYDTALAYTTHEGAVAQDANKVFTGKGAIIIRLNAAGTQDWSYTDPDAGASNFGRRTPLKYGGILYFPVLGYGIWRFINP